METEHTPGPLTIQSARNAYDIYADNPERLVGKAYLAKDARLFAASPDLLAALLMFRVNADDECYDACRANGLRDHGPGCLAAQAAIRKATEV